MKALTKTDFKFEGQKSVYHGKVRDVYNINDDLMVMVVQEVKIKNNEKEVAKIHGINPKTLHRWIVKGLKKNQGKYIYLI